MSGSNVVVCYSVNVHLETETDSEIEYMLFCLYFRPDRKAKMDIISKTWGKGCSKLMWVVDEGVSILTLLLLFIGHE